MRSLTSRQNGPNLGAAAKSKWLQIFCYLELENFSGFCLNDTVPIWDLIYHGTTHSQSLTTSKKWFLRHNFCELWNIDLTVKVSLLATVSRTITAADGEFWNLGRTGMLLPMVQTSHGPAESLQRPGSRYVILTTQTLYNVYCVYRLIRIFTSILQETLNVSLWSKWLSWDLNLKSKFPDSVFVTSYYPASLWGIILKWKKKILVA